MPALGEGVGPVLGALIGLVGGFVIATATSKNLDPREIMEA
jgi:predicted anti-sigma-YlaC factor YlaD